MNVKKWVIEDTYKDIPYEIVFWTREGMNEGMNDFVTELYTGEYDGYTGIFNSYIFVRKDKNKELFNKVNLTKKNGFYNYFSIENIVPMENGLSYYEKKRGENGIRSIKIGNDYNHAWNDGSESFESIEGDIKNTIDKITESNK